MYSKRWVPCFLVAGLLMVLGGCGSEGTTDRVLVAGNIPLTGPIAAFSGQYGNGFQMGIDEACAEFEVSCDAFRVDFQDNAGSTTTAVAVMRQQLLANPTVYVSGTSAMSDAIVREISERRIPHFLVSFDAFMTHGDSTILRLLPNFKIEAPAFVQFIEDRGQELGRSPRVVFFTPNLKAYLEQSDQLILPALDERGIAYHREVFENDTRNFRTLVERAIGRLEGGAGPDVVVISGYAFHVYPILRALREMGATEAASVISTLDFIDLLRGDTPIDDLKGIWFTSPVCEIPGMVPAYDAWRTRFTERFGQTPSYVDAYAYETGRLLVRTWAERGDITPEGILSLGPVDGIVGYIQLDDEGDLATTLVVGYVDEDGEVRLASESRGVQ